MPSLPTLHPSHNIVYTETLNVEIETRRFTKLCDFVFEFGYQDQVNNR